MSLRPRYLIHYQLCSQAYDDDQPDTNNSRLLFNLLPGPYSQNFSINPDTGVLRNLEPLDREDIDPALEGQIVLTVRVADCGDPPSSTDVNVTITVEVRQCALTQLSSLILVHVTLPALYSMVDESLRTQPGRPWQS